MSLRQADFTGDAARDAVSSLAKCLTQGDIGMDTAKAEGAVQEVAGKVQGAAGARVGDSAAHLAGKARELAGKAQQLRADATSAVRETTATNPFMAPAVVAAVSFLAGAIWRAGGLRRNER
jgi:uncharacterized protein YjbJ (UPF0337 family)